VAPKLGVYGWQLEVVTIKQRWIDGYLRKGRVGPWDVGLLSSR
jgi:hypothetical protein